MVISGFFSEKKLRKANTTMDINIVFFVINHFFLTLNCFVHLILNHVNGHLNFVCYNSDLNRIKYINKVIAVFILTLQNQSHIIILIYQIKYSLLQ